MRIVGVLPNSYVNGEGLRLVIFTQGCKHYCKGCQNKSTWDFKGGQEVSIKQLVEYIKLPAHRFIDGITLSGGDPYYQKEECAELLKQLPNKLNVWIYTGFEWDEIKDEELTSLADVVVTGRFIEELKCTGKMYGSSNQEIHRIKNKRRT